MTLYGTALLAVCHLLGILLGELLGRALGVPANVGGVGIAMLLLISARLYGHHRGWLDVKSEEGVNYWGALYIPVVVAMAMTQNVVAALRGGPMAVTAAVLTVALCACCIAFINRLEPAAGDAPSPAQE
ncbi:MAG: malonate transporter subunit MadL [Verrucomicrobiota bacterium]|jgi:malonate transporter MadL subunit